MVALMAPLALKEQRYRKRETEALVAIEREMERNLAALREAAEHRFRRNYDVARTGCALADTPLFIVAHVEAAYADDICDERALLEALKALGECLDKRAPARKQKRPADGPGASVSGTADA
ncbi:hypothetical protein [Maricaulis maris]|uniref:hypothetical protein n=1 Tax=Maricaulis maris TaxID=74318 RepID=UPI003B8DD298